jgi:hypothetical protein
MIKSVLVDPMLEIFYFSVFIHILGGVYVDVSCKI